ncbi:RING-type domain-containing protein [Caenorhabditis elegans]|uniref:RING-type domain-containing protein n=1 Tax=Caenorhabditis elegans TaxID=6239 RepID=U4PAR2_CAEEL|nr:RING-type domain-containing protein [Caenorhabditis elegans]CDH92980.1 RING-type domain-containing protein [Caenorhabditis elegans]|eukprot:NP_001294283.1 Uncharacterized protein CELE_F15E6.9 [Caenorhabditis elegans]
MGCQVSTDGSQFERSDYDKLWKRMNSVSEPVPSHGKKPPKNVLAEHGGWKILRILLVSTYKDFRNERRAVLDLVENKLQPIASEKHVILQVEDFSWGSKAHLEEASSLYLIERLCREAVSSSSYFYLHFLGECSGYILDPNFTDQSFLRQHSISTGQSFSEVFLQLSGLQNEKSLFLYRNPSFHQELPFNVTHFIDGPVNRERAKYLTTMVRGEAPASKFIEYSVRTSGINNIHFKHIMFDELSGITKPIEAMVGKYLEKLPDGEAGIPSVEEFMNEYYSQLHVNQTIMSKIEYNLKSHKSILLVGDYCTGKTSILHRIQWKYRDAVIVQAKEKMSAIELRRAIEAKTNVILHDVEQKVVRYLLVDDIHLASKEAQQYLIGNEELVIVATSRKKKLEVDMNRIIIPHLEPEDILDELSFWLNGGEKEKSGVPSVKASNILKMSQQKRRRSIGTVEDGHQPDENIGWNSLKCRVIGTLGRIGSSDEKCAQLAQLSTLSVVEADMCLMESDGKGHLLIATLCYLTIVESGLNEMELRSLLILEYNLLPIAIRRNYKNLPFDYCPDEFGTTSCTQTLPLRWYFVLHRLGHLFMKIDGDSNHFVLPSACRRVVFKKYLKHPHNLEHFKKNFKEFLTNFSGKEWNRNRQIKMYL